MALLLIVVLGAVLRFRGLGEDSLWIDEAATWQQTQGDVLSTIIATGRDTYPPLYNLLVLIAIKLAGTSEWALRLPAAIAGSLAILGIYWLGWIVGGRRVAVLSALLLALAPFAIFFSQEARAYSLLMLASILYVACVLSIASTRSKWMSVALVASGFALLYSHPYGIFTWLAVSAAVFVPLYQAGGWRRLFGFVGLQAIVVVLFAPWILITIRVMGQIADQGSWLPTPTWNRGLDALLSVAGGVPPLVAIIVGSIGIFFVRARSTGDAEQAPPGTWAILIAAIAGPIVLGLAFSLLVDSIFSGRYFIACLPPVLVVVAVGLVRMLKFQPWGAVVAAAVIAVFAAAASAVPVVLRHGEDWRSAAALLDSEMLMGDCLLVHEDFTYRALEYYRDHASDCTFTDPDEVESSIPPSAAVYVVLSHTGEKMSRIARSLDRAASLSSRHFGEGIEIARLEPKQGPAP